MSGWILVLALFGPGDLEKPTHLHSIYQHKTKAVCESNGKLIAAEFIRTKRAGSMRFVCVPAHEGEDNARP